MRMSISSDKPIPLAYFITYHTYATWLHGDRRESMDRRYFNKSGATKIPQDDRLRRVEESLQRQDTFMLSSAARSIVRNAIRDVCVNRAYTLHALNVRTNHAHIVVTGSAPPEKIMNEFKAYSTRRLREAGLARNDQKIWVRHGSTRYLWKPSHLSGAIAYVIYGQGDDVPNFNWIDGV